jgi:tryptophan-rich sensory protein
MNPSVKQTVKTYIVAILIPLAVGFLSAFLTRNSMMIYGDIVRPSLSPPAILFPIVWTILYVLMGVSSAMVWTHRKETPADAWAGLAYYAASLIFNFGWSILLFSFRQYLAAFLWLLVLWYLILKTIQYYRKVVPLAAYLQIPYLLWVTFAGYLNFGIYLLN